MFVRKCFSKIVLRGFIVGRVICVKHSWPDGDVKQIVYTMVRKFREVHVNTQDLRNK